VAGFLGKLPTVGDFLIRGLADEIADGWMDQLDRAFTAATKVKGADWYDTCQTRPTIGFAMAAGVVGERGQIGLIRASIDRFARSYPLVISAELPAGHPVLHAPRGCRGWYERAGIALLAAIEGTLDADGLAHFLARLPVPENTEAATTAIPGPDPHPAGWWLPRGPGDDAYAEPLETLLLRHGRPSIWWEVGETAGDRLLLHQPPTGRQLAAILDGDRIGWSLTSASDGDGAAP